MENERAKVVKEKVYNSGGYLFWTVWLEGRERPKTIRLGLNSGATDAEISLAKLNKTSLLVNRPEGLDTMKKRLYKTTYSFKILNEVFKFQDESFYLYAVGRTQAMSIPRSFSKLFDDENMKLVQTNAVEIDTINEP